MIPFFSIIMPVYNAEPYLREGLDSIVKQEFKDWELICVNDGSTDNSLLILEEYCSKNNNIKLINIDNSGTAVARNEGIKSAIGEYVLFFDSDDWIATGSLEILFRSLDSHPVDILSFNGNLYHEERGITESDERNVVMPQKGWDYYNEHVLQPRTFHFVCVVIRAYRRSFLLGKELFFEPGILHEDNLFTPVAFYHANRVAEIPDILYYYRIRHGSKMQEHSFRQIKDKCEVSNRLGDFFFTKTGQNLTAISKVLASDYISLYSQRTVRISGSRYQEIMNSIDKTHFKRACITPRHRFLHALIHIHPALYRSYIKLVKSLH